MAYILDHTSYTLEETDIDAANGQVTSTSTITLSNLTPGTVVVAAHYVESTSTWKLLIANPG